MPFVRRSLMLPCSVARRLHWVTAAAALVSVLLVASGFALERHQSHLALVADIRATTLAASSIAAAFQAEEVAGRLSHTDAQSGAMTAIGAMRGFDGATVRITSATPDAADGPQALSFAALVRDVDQAVFTGASAQSGSKIAYVARMPSWGWVISCSAGASFRQWNAWRSLLLMSLAALWAVLAVGLAVNTTGRRIAMRLRALAAAAELLSQGDARALITDLDSGDEISALAHGLEKMRRHEQERGRIVRLGLAERLAKERRQTAMDRLTREFSQAVSGALTRLALTARALEHQPETARRDGSFADHDVSVDVSDDVSDDVSLAVLEIRDAADTLRDEVDAFVLTLSRGDALRRRYERLPGNDMSAQLMIPNGPRIDVIIHDISRGGAALRTPYEGEVGAAILLRLPGAREAVSARIVRHAAGLLAVAFRQDDQTRFEVDLALDALPPRNEN